MTNSRVRARGGSVLLVVLLVCGCSASATEGRSSPATAKVVLMPQPWRTIHPTDDDRVMLIDIAQNTRRSSDPCWTRAVTRVEFRHARFYITLREGEPLLRPNQVCAAIAVKGPFYATVHLPVPYRGQPLIDAVSAQRHRPSVLVKLRDVPKQFR